MFHRTLNIALGTALVAAAAAFAPAAHADRVGFNVSIGGPGYGVSFGNAPYWGGHHHRHHYRPYRHYRPHWRAAYYYDYYAPPVVYYRAPRVVYRAPYYVAPRPVIVHRPYYGY